jgi:hypothetical protein
MGNSKAIHRALSIHPSILPSFHHALESISFHCLPTETFAQFFKKVKNSVLWCLLAYVGVFSGVLRRWLALLSARERAPAHKSTLFFVFSLSRICFGNFDTKIQTLSQPVVYSQRLQRLS